MKLGEFIAGAGLTKRVWDDMQRQEDADAYTNEARKLDLQRQRSVNMMLPEQQAAQRAQLGLSTAQANAATPLVGKRAQVESNELDVQGAVSAEKAKRAPDIAAAAGNSIEAARKESELQLKEAGFKLEDWPRYIKAIRGQNAIDGVKQKVFLLAGLKHALATGDAKTVLDYVNATAEEGSPFEDYAEAVLADNQGKERPAIILRRKDDSGTVIFKDDIETAYKHTTPREIKEVAGNLVEIPPGGGEVKTLYSAPKVKETESGRLIDENAALDKQPPAAEGPIGGKKLAALITDAEKMVTRYLMGTNQFASMDKTTQEQYKKIMLENVVPFLQAGDDAATAVRKAIDKAEADNFQASPPPGGKKSDVPARIKEKLDSLGPEYGF